LKGRQVNSAPVHDLLAARRHEGVANSIDERLSQELIIALVGPVGSGVSTAAQFIQAILANDFGYDVCPIIKPSEIIRAEAPRVEMADIAPVPLDKYITHMQTAGNALRDKFGGNYLIEKAVERICKFRKEKGGYADNGVPLPGRRAYIIDSLKHPDELLLLRKIYGETLCVFGVFAPESMRAARLKNSGAAEESVKNIMDRDRGEAHTFGQKTRKLFIESDFFICNDHKEDELKAKILRFVNIIFNVGIHTPYRAESAMYEASSASSNSACMSRQVGASIVSKGGELIAVGWNDVPRFGGGLYNEDRQSVWDEEKKAVIDLDFRCFKWGKRICHNDTRRKDIVDNIISKISKAGILKRGTDHEKVREALGKTEIDSLIEFSRAIHAEMEAILSVAREGRHSIAESTLYTTTYPCHNCARHIVASGITTVIYIEPYDKSLATALHYDAITETPNDTTRVVFRQYDGVAPRSYLRLFRSTAERKKDGEVRIQPPKFAVPVFRVPLDSPADYEAKVIAELSHKEHSVR
jgi:deoxycytidylate deaminase